MFLPEAIFFRIICHFKKVFALLRNVRGVLENRRSAKRSRWVVLLEVQAWYRRESKWESLGKYIGAAHIGRCYLSHLDNNFLQGTTPPRLTTGLEMSVVAVILDRCIGSWVTNIK